MLEIPYKVLFDNEDFKKLSGYDLHSLNQGDFQNIDEAIQQFKEEAAQSVFDIISANRGYDKAKEIQEDEDFKNALGLAQVYEAIFFYENGNLDLGAQQVENTVKHSKRAVRTLMQNGIIRLAVC